MKIKLLIAVLLFGLASCKLYYDMITDWYYTSDEIEKWIVDSTQFSFEMVDQYWITREFVNLNNTHSFIEGTGYIAFIKDSRSQSEYFYQKFLSNYNDEFNISISPEINSYIGEQIRFQLSGVNFAYDLFYNEVVDVSVNWQYKQLSINSDGIQSDSL